MPKSVGVGSEGVRSLARLMVPLVLSIHAAGCSGTKQTTPEREESQGAVDPAGGGVQPDDQGGQGKSQADGGGLQPLPSSAPGISAPSAPGNSAPATGEQGGVSPSQRDGLLAEREGWGAGVTGGTASFVVTSLADSGAGSLREALSAPGRWITFGVSGTIALESPLWVPPHTTIDARTKAIKIETVTAGPKAALLIHGASNVIITNLNLDNARISGTNWNQDSEGQDAVEIRNSVDVWIHRNTFGHWADGAIDARYSDNSTSGLQLPWGGTGLPQVLPSRISVTRNRFFNIYQALNFTADRISFGHNHCSNVKRRCIKAIFGRAYSYNNLIEGWADERIQDVKDLPSGINPPGQDQYGNFVGNPVDRFGAPRAELLSEQNFFRTDPSAVGPLMINNVSKGKMSCRMNHGNVQFVDVTNDINQAVYNEVTSGPYAVRRLDCQQGDAACVQQRMTAVANGAGASSN